MNKLRIIIPAVFVCCLLSAFQQEISVPNTEGYELFIAKCSSCHATNRAVVGPPFQEIRKDYSIAWINAMVRNHDSMCNSGDIHARYLYKVWSMWLPDQKNNLTDKEISLILDYVDSIPTCKQYYSHRHMSDKELTGTINYIRDYNGDIDSRLRMMDSLKKL